MGESSLLCLSTLQESDYHLYPVNREFKEQGGAFKEISQQRKKTGAGEEDSSPDWEQLHKVFQEVLAFP